MDGFIEHLVLCVMLTGLALRPWLMILLSLVLPLLVIFSDIVELHEHIFFSE